MNSFLLLPRVVLIITVSAQCALILLLWRPIGKKKRIFKLEGLVLVSVISLYEANRVGAQCLRSWGRRASSHLRKGRPIIFGTVSETMDPQKVNIKNTLHSSVKQNDTSPCFQKDYLDCFDVPELSPLFSCVVVLGKKEMTSLETEGWELGECAGNGMMGCECNRNRSGHNYFLCILESSFSDHGTPWTKTVHTSFSSVSSKKGQLTLLSFLLIHFAEKDPEFDIRLFPETAF